MWMKQISRGRQLMALFVALMCLASAETLAAGRSQLSYWLSDTALEEIEALASGHPRLVHRSLHVSSVATSALDEAIAITLQASLTRLQHLQLVAPAARTPIQPGIISSVDDLACEAATDWDNELQVSVLDLGKGRAEVQIDLVDTTEPDVAFQTWRWRGSLNKAEREYLSTPPQRSGNEGSLSAPWKDTELEQAAVRLGEQLACDMRPDIYHQAKVQWPDQQSGPAPVSATVSEIRRRLGAYREISESHEGADYRMHVAWHPVSQGVWQLSVVGVPLSDGLLAIDAATYIEAELDQFSEDAGYASILSALPLEAPQPGQPASKYLNVEMVDVSQTNKALARAALRVRLRLVNRANRPMEYGLSLSAGHYLQCIPEPQFYRHDRYGYMEGRLAPGQSIVKEMEIDGARHNPNPFFGTPKCAGFSGLEGFEDFANQGHKVTQFIRWTL